MDKRRVKCTLCHAVDYQTDGVWGCPGPMCTGIVLDFPEEEWKPYADVPLGWIVERNKQERFDDYGMDLAFCSAKMSKDPSTKVGAVILDGVTNVVKGTGWNGFARGVPETPELLNDRDKRLALTVHAELNAIMNSTVGQDMRLYCTLHPCAPCTGAIIQFGIKTVICPPDYPERWAESIRLAKFALDNAGVEMVYWESDNADNS